jgi:hypothetical protein
MMSLFLSSLAGAGWKKLALGLAAAIVVAVLVGLAAWRGYRAGYEKADAERRAQVAELRGEHALALADAERQARALLEEQTARANELERQYLAASNTIAAQRRTITNERIRHASRDVDVSGGACRLGPEWVRLYNAAVGADSGDGGAALPPTASGPDADPGAAPEADTGILRGGPAVTSVTPEDILAHVRDYGSRCRDIEARLLGLQEWAGGLGGEVQP